MLYAVACVEHEYVSITDILYMIPLNTNNNF